MFKIDDNKCYQMPVQFSGYDPAGTVYHNVVSITYTYTTDGDRLADFLPEGFELLRPELIISFSQNRECEFLAGSGYNLIGVIIPARFRGQHDRVDGQYVLVMWENKTQPILGGREQTGIPKISADIQDLHKIQQNYFTNASFEGNTFLRLELLGAQPVEGQKLAEMKAQLAERALFGWRYLPKVGGPGADLSQFILYPQSSETASAWIGKGAVQWTELTWQQSPYFNIIKTLAELPIIDMAPAVMTQSVDILKVDQSRVLT